MSTRAGPVLTLAALAALAAGCVGSVGRVADGCPVGWPPFDAVAIDARIVSGEMLPKDRWMAPVAVLSVPLDLVLDVVLLPLDCGAGLLGYRRDGAVVAPAPAATPPTAAVAR